MTSCDDCQQMMPPQNEFSSCCQVIDHCPMTIQHGYDDGSHKTVVSGCKAEWKTRLRLQSRCSVPSSQPGVLRSVVVVTPELVFHHRVALSSCSAASPWSRHAWRPIPQQDRCWPDRNPGDAVNVKLGADDHLVSFFCCVLDCQTSD